MPKSRAATAAAETDDAGEFRGPQMGDIVLFTGAEAHNGAKTYPAIVAQVFDGPYINLKVLPPFAQIRDEGSVSHRDTPDAPPDRYWIWPGEV